MRVREVVSCASRQVFEESVVPFVRGKERKGEGSCGIGVVE